MQVLLLMSRFCQAVSPAVFHPTSLILSAVMKAIVLGGGMVGLATAAVLLERGNVGVGAGGWQR